MVRYDRAATRRAISLPDGGYVLKPGDGDGWWFLGSRMDFLADASTTHGGLAVFRNDCPPGFQPPLHRHDAEDEMFYMLKGAIQVTCDDQSWIADEGSFVMLPRRTAHTLRVVGDVMASFLVFTTPSRFQHVVTEVGQPATGAGLPLESPSPEEVQLVREACARYGIEILDVPKHPA